MKKRYIAPIMLLLAVAGCESGGPSAPDGIALSAAFTGIFIPTAVASDGRCGLTLENSAIGGNPFEPNENEDPYLSTWQISWRELATDIRGFPAEKTVRMTLPDGFGPGSFPIDLVVEDEAGDVDRAEANPELDCEAVVALNFTGS